MERNTMTEILRFYNWLDHNPISASCIALWHALMNVANVAGLNEWITVPVATLESKSGLSRTALYRARNNLEQVGRIEVKKRKGNQCAAYRLCPIRVYNQGRSAGYSAEQESGRSSGYNPGTYGNQTKPNEMVDGSGGMRAWDASSFGDAEHGGSGLSAAWARVADRYAAQIGRMPMGDVMHALMEQVDVLGADVVCVAIDHVNDKQPNSPMPYLQTILRAWVSLGIKTVEAATENIRQHEAARKSAVPPARTGDKVVDAQRYSQRDYSDEDLNSLFEII